MARFYGFSYYEIENMPFCDLEKYRKGISYIRAAEVVDLMRIAEYPNLKNESKERVISNLEESSRLETSRKILTMDELIEAMR